MTTVALVSRNGTMLAKLAAWFKSFFKSPPAEWEGSRYDLYRPEDRYIYAYWDGQKEIKTDPLVLYKRLMEQWNEISTDMKVARSPSKANRAAHVSMMKRLREVFLVKTYEEGGLTDWEVSDLLDHFLVYTQVVKKNSSPSATSPAGGSPTTPTPSAPASGAGSEGSQATPSSSGSGSTESEPPTSTPTPSPSEPESPSA